MKLKQVKLEHIDHLGNKHTLICWIPEYEVTKVQKTQLISLDGENAKVLWRIANEYGVVDSKDLDFTRGWKDWKPGDKK